MGWQWAELQPETEIRSSAGDGIICVELPLLCAALPCYGFVWFLVRDEICVDVTLKGGFDIGVVEPVSDENKSRMGDLGGRTRSASVVVVFSFYKRGKLEDVSGCCRRNSRGAYG